MPLRLSWKFWLSWKLLAAIVALFFHISHMFHDIVTVVDYRCEMVFWSRRRAATRGHMHPGGTRSSRENGSSPKRAVREPHPLGLPYACDVRSVCEAPAPEV